jgi:hypothetical protein
MHAAPAERLDALSSRVASSLSGLPDPRMPRTHLDRRAGADVHVDAYLVLTSREVSQLLNERGAG